MSTAVGARVLRVSLCFATVAALGCATAAAATSPTALKSLEKRLAAAQRAARHHRTLPAAAYKRIGKLTVEVAHALPARSAACRTALKAAGRLAGERRHVARLRADVKRVSAGVARCKSAKSAPAPAPTPSAPPAAPAQVGGQVVNAAGQPLAQLPITVDVDDPLSFFGKEWTATTDATGHFTLPWPTSDVASWYSWTATTTFPWAGGTWPWNLATAADADPAHLVFQSVVANAATVGFSDDQGCEVFWADPEYPASNPQTQSVSFTLTPARASVDGSPAAAAHTVTLAKLQLCDGGNVGVSAGDWIASGGHDDLGRALLLSADGGHTYSPSVELFDSPHNGEFPSAGVEVEFANPPGN